MKFPHLQEIAGDFNGGNDIEYQRVVGLSCNFNRSRR